MNWDNFADIFEWETRLISEYQNRDIEFWIDFADNCKALDILELGAGSGRITIPLLEAGFRLTALDSSQAMLKKLKDKYDKSGGELRVELSDMSSFELNQEYDLCIVTYSSFQHLLTISEQVSCLKNIKSHLKPDGIAAFDLDPSVMDLPYEQKEVILYSEYNPEILAEVDMFTSWNTDMDNKIRHWNDKYYLKYSNNKTDLIENHIALRDIKLENFKDMLKEQGLEVCDVYGGFEKEEFTINSYRMIVIAINSNK